MSSPKNRIASQLPGHFSEQYPQFVKFLEQYYEFLESTVMVLENNKTIRKDDILYGSLSKAKAKILIVSNDRIYFEYETETNNFYKNEILINIRTGELYNTVKIYKNIYGYIRDIEDNTCYDMVLNLFKKYFRKNVSFDQSIFRNIDPNILTKRILDYYKNKDTENSFFWFFRIFFDEPIEIYYPKVDILRLSSSDYQSRRWMQISQANDVAKFKQAQIVGQISKASAYVRDLKITNVGGTTKYFLDLIFINGSFLPHEEIFAYDYITGEKVTESKTIESVTKIKHLDGGIGHQLDNRFVFGSINSDGFGKVAKMKKHSVTKINIEYPGVFYGVGDEITFDNTYTGATVPAKAYVSKIEKNEELSNYIFDFNKSIKNLTIGTLKNMKLKDYKNYKLGHVNPNGFFPKLEVGSIKEIRFERSGLDYDFEPVVRAFSNKPGADAFLYFDLLFDEWDSNVADIQPGKWVEIYGVDCLCVGVKQIEGSSLGGLDIEGEDYEAKQFIMPKINIKLTQVTISNYMNSPINAPAFQQTSFTKTQPLKLIQGLDVKIKDTGNIVKIVDVVSTSNLNESANLSAVLGEGIAEMKLTTLGLSGTSGAAPRFLDSPEEQTFDADHPTIQHGLEAPIEYEYNVLFEPFGEYLGTASKVSSDKFMQDGYYYQDFSYEIRTKISAEKIEPLLLDELHPAGFIHFIRNRFESELAHRITTMELPEVEVENSVYVDTEAVGFTELEIELGIYDDLLRNPDLITYEMPFENYLPMKIEDYGKRVLKKNQYSVPKRRVQGFPELEMEYEAKTDLDGYLEYEAECESFIDELRIFEFFCEDVVTFPQNFNLNVFDNYMSTESRMNIINSSVILDQLVPSVYSYCALISVEDSANWRTSPIKYRQGPIGNMADQWITNLRVTTDVGRFQTGTNWTSGGVLLMRDDPWSQPIVVSNATPSEFASHGFIPTAEVYTKYSGWVKVKDIQGGDYVAHVMEDGRVDWRMVDDVYENYYNGLFLEVTDDPTVEREVALDQLIYTNMSTTIDQYTGTTILAKKPPPAPGDKKYTSISVTPYSDLILFSNRNQYRREKAINVTFEEQETYFGRVDLAKIGTSERTAIKSDIKDFSRRIWGYQGKVYTLSVRNEKPHVTSNPVKWSQIDLMLMRIVEKPDAVFTIKLKQVLQKVLTYRIIGDRNKFIGTKERIVPFMGIPINKYKDAVSVEGTNRDTLPSSRTDGGLSQILSRTKVEMSDLQIVEFMEKLIQPPTSVSVESKIKPTESFTGFVKNIPDRYRLVSTTGDFTPILPDIIFDKRNMILWSGDLKEGLPSMQLLPIEQQLLNETQIQSCETFSIESMPSITKDTNVSMPIMITDDDPLSSITNLRYVYSRNAFMEGAKEIKINLKDKINEYKKLRIWTGDIKEFIPTVRVDETIASFSGGLHSHFDLPSKLLETQTNVIALSGSTTKQTTVEAEHSIREYSNTKLKEVETTAYQAVQTLHEYSMPENWLEYQTIVYWDTNNYTKPISEGHHHEVEKHIRVPDRNLLFTPETSIDFSLKMKIQEYKNRILWMGDVKEGLPSPVIFQRTDNATIDILTETTLPETLFHIDYNIEEHVHNKSRLTTGSSSSVTMSYIAIPDRNRLISFGGSMDAYQKEIIEYLRKMRIWDGDIREGLPSPKVTETRTGFAGGIMQHNVLPDPKTSRYSNFGCYEMHRMGANTLHQWSVELDHHPFRLKETEAFAESHIRSVEEEPQNISANILPLEFEHTQEDTIRVVEFKEDFIEVRSVITTDLNKQTVEGHQTKVVAAIDKSELEAYTNLLFDYDHKVRINETKRIEDIRIQKKARLVEVQHIRTHERKDTSKIDEFLATQWIEPFADMVVDDFLDDVIFDSDSHIQDDLKLKYTFSEIFVANTTIGEMLNSNNYIDSSGTVLGSSPMSVADFEKLLNSANTYIKFDSGLSSNDVLETIRTPYVVV